MEFTLQLPLIIFFITTILTYTIIKSSKRVTPAVTVKLPPGPPKLPLIGNLHQLASTTTLAHRRLAALATEYGPLMHLKLGEIPVVVVSSAETAKEVMKTHDAVLCNRPTLMMPKVVLYGCTDIGFAPYGEYWRQVRKIATLELFTSARVRSLRTILVEEVTDLVRSLVSESGTLVNLSQNIFDLTFNITLRTTMNKKGKDGREFKALVADAAKVTSGFSIADLYPSLKFLYPISGMKRKLEYLVKRTDNIMNPIIQEHIENKQRVQDHTVVEDLVDVLLTFHKGDMNHNSSDFSLGINNIKAIVLELFGAGSETSSTVIEWSISELLKNPGAMEKAKDEVRRVLKGKETIDEASLGELKYLKLVIKETLRLHPPIPLLVPRQSMERCQIKGYDIPQNTRVFINAWMIGRDPKYWVNPEKFYPERFEGSVIDYKGNHFELIPFGSGRRICPGMGLGMATIELALASLLFHFDWKLPQGTTPNDLDMEETFGVVARRKNDLQIIPLPYSSPTIQE